jgi:hypothetical protein
MPLISAFCINCVSNLTSSSESADLTPAAQAVHPGERVAEARLQRGGQPASATTAVEEPRGAIAGVTLAATATTHPALIEARFHLLTAMGQFRRPHHLPGRIVEEGQPRRLAAGVDLEPHRLRLLSRFTFLEDDGEGKSAVDRRPSTVQQMPRTAWMHRSARSALVVHHQDHRHGVPSFRTPLAGVRVPSSVFGSGTLPDALAVIPICLFNAGLAAPGTEAPSQGANVNTPPKRLLARGQGTGQHQGSCKPPPSGVGSLTFRCAYITITCPSVPFLLRNGW